MQQPTLFTWDLREVRDQCANCLDRKPETRFARLINMRIEPYLLSSCIIGVLGIRLIRKICSACSEPYAPEAPLLRLVPEELRGMAFRRGAGCKACLP